ncbi:MAG: CvpA family protein [Chloroflexi bacterium]|nr:CvpA family protein [Chloroflexota bacterium]
MSINWLDIVILLFLFVGMFLGLWQGGIRYILALGGFYAGIVLSSRLYSVVSTKLLELSPRTIPAVSDVLAFFVLMFVFGIVLTLLFMDMLRGYTDRPVGGLGHMTGAVVGLAIAVMLIAISLVALRFMTNTSWGASGDGWRIELVGVLDRSLFLPVFRSVIPVLMQGIRLGGGSLPPLFSAELGA